MNVVAATLGLLAWLVAVAASLLIAVLLPWGAFGAFMHSKAVLRASGTPQTTCDTIPPKSVVFVPAFLNRGVQNGRFRSDPSNGQLARRLEECSNRIALVVTQKAVSDALDVGTSLRNGTPVMQMHEHVNGIDVRTFAALKAALDRFDDKPAQIVLMAHPEQLDRAVMDFTFLYSGPIVPVWPGEVLYPSCGAAIMWHLAKSPIGWVADWLLIRATDNARLRWLKPPLKLIGAQTEYPGDVKLPRRIRLVDGKWVEQ